MGYFSYEYKNIKTLSELVINISFYLFLGYILGIIFMLFDFLNRIVTRIIRVFVDGDKKG